MRRWLPRAVTLLTAVETLGSAHQPSYSGLSPHEAILLNSFESTDIDSWSYYYTHGVHLAGTNETEAQWTVDKFASYGFDARLVSYDVYLNYPVNKSLLMTSADGSVFYPKLAEDVLEEDETTTYPDRVPTFHGYSASGSAEAEFVYVG
jgi:N-acetylated-alpha-linked acidic dipeptidase